MNSDITILFRILNDSYDLYGLLEKLGIARRNHSVINTKSEESGDHYVAIICDQNEIVFTQWQLLILDYPDFEIISID